MSDAAGVVAGYTFSCPECGREFDDALAAAHCLCIATAAPAVADCPPCEDLASFKAALVEMRRGLVSLERGFAALLAVVDRDGCG